MKRPDITSHAQIVDDLVRKVNETALYPLSDTDVVKIALERLWKDAFPDKPLPQLERKRYHELPF